MAVNPAGDCLLGGSGYFYEQAADPNHPGYAKVFSSRRDLVFGDRSPADHRPVGLFLFDVLFCDRRKVRPDLMEIPVRLSGLVTPVRRSRPVDLRFGDQTIQQP